MHVTYMYLAGEEVRNGSELYKPEGEIQIIVNDNYYSTLKHHTPP